MITDLIGSDFWTTWYQFERFMHRIIYVKSPPSDRTELTWVIWIHPAWWMRNYDTKWDGYIIQVGGCNGIRISTSTLA